MFRRKSKLFWGTVVAGTSAAAYYIWTEMEKRAKDETSERNRNTLMIDGKPNRSGIQHGMENLDETCKVWEAALQEAIVNGDIATVNRIRRLLRRAYATVESFNNSFGHPGAGASVAVGGSEAASFVSAETSQNYEQDLTGFDEGGSAGGAALNSSGGAGEHPAASIATHSTADLWLEALRLQQGGKIEYRKDRSTETGVVTGDFAARLHCFRQSINYIAARPSQISVIRNCVTRAISGCITLHGDDPAGFKAAMQRFEEYCTTQILSDGGEKMLEELKPKNIPCIGVYELALEFILFDSLDDLAAPPQAVVSILHNTWVPMSMRNRGLKGVVWAAIASRRALTAKGSFCEAFYDLCKSMSPTLACGMLKVGDKDFVNAMDEFQRMTMEWICVCFAIPGTIPNMTEELYAEKIMEKVRIYAPRILETIATAIRLRDE